jgi:hypothetical protein
MSSTTYPNGVGAIVAWLTCFLPQHNSFVLQAPLQPLRTRNAGTPTLPNTAGRDGLICCRLPIQRAVPCYLLAAALLVFPPSRPTAEVVQKHNRQPSRFRGLADAIGLHFRALLPKVRRCGRKLVRLGRTVPYLP